MEVFAQSRLSFVEVADQPVDRRPELRIAGGGVGIETGERNGLHVAVLIAAE